MQILKIFIIALFIAFASVTAPANAQAHDSCGQAIGPDKIGEAVGYCNMYERQLAYREGRIEFRKQLEERRKDYIAPQTEVLKKYKKDLEALNNERNFDNDISSF